MLEDIEAYLSEHNKPKFHIKQIRQAVFQQNKSHFSEITTLPKALREELDSKFKLTTFMLLESHKSGNTVKFVLKSDDGNVIESVLMLHRDGRRTVCVSSQVFCAVGCTFCATGANQFQRNLSTREIVEQVLFVARYLKHKDERVTNVVFMGMGEPFLNYDKVVEAIKIFKSPDYFNIGARHITVSTSGIIPKIYAYTNANLKTRLAISLHAANDKLRTELMPINKPYPLKDLMAACDDFVEKTNKRVSYEYVLIRNVNDRLEHAKELVELLKGRLAHLNLLIYNPHEFADFEMPFEEDVIAFRDYVQSQGIEVSIRKSMGDDISGACGQLSGKIVRKQAEPEYFENEA